MVTLLSLETTGSSCSVAIQHRGRWYEDTREVDRLHNRVVLQMVDDLLQTADLPRQVIDWVAFANGPGSFTGVRIATAVSQGVALAVNAKVLPVASSRVLAHNARYLLAAHPAMTLITSTYSRSEAYYLAAYDVLGELLQPDTLCDAQKQPDWLSAERLAAKQPGLWVGKLPPWMFPLPASWRVEQGVGPSARAVAELALIDGASRALDPEFALPHYLAADSPWRPMEK